MAKRTAPRRLLHAFVAALLLQTLVLSQAASAKRRPSEPAPPTTTTKTLVLYDSSNSWGYLGELYAMGTGNLVSHFGPYTAKPVTQYTPGEINNYTAAVYVGSTWDEPIPTSFLDDTLAGTRPVMWINRNIWQLTARAADFRAQYGWSWWQYDHSGPHEVLYKGISYRRPAGDDKPIMDYDYLDRSRVSVLAEAVRPDGTTIPWAIRSGNLTYVGENPFTYMAENDRYLIFCDLLFDLLAPNTPERHRALVRLEDVGPDADPQTLREIADYLYSQRIPFSFGVYTTYKDPNGVDNGGVPQTLRLKDTPEVVQALRYMINRGGTMLMHGYTHQFDGLINPYNGKSGDDFEFYTAHVDEQDYVRLDGPVPGDSTAWALSRVDGATREFKAVKLPVPTIFEFPHYAGSAIDYRAIATRFSTRYERGLYFSGVLEGGPVDHSKLMGQFFPYVVKDVYGTKVLPENLGNIETAMYNHHPERWPADIVATARRNLGVRDGFASFFYHPFLGVDLLRQTVEGIRGLGYTFVSPTSL